MYGDTNPLNGGDPTNGLYGAGRFAYSINQFSASATVLQLQPASWAQVQYMLNYLNLSLEFTKVTVTTPTTQEESS
jgi:hypothetical protein